MASSRDTARSAAPAAAAAPAAGSGGHAQQGVRQEDPDAGDTQRQQQRQQHQQQRQTDQQQEQPKGGDRLKTLLREVARSEELLKDCIHVREELGAAKMKIMRAREEARQTSRTRRSPCSLEFDGESWDWSDGVDFGGVEDSGRFGSDTANVGEEQEQLAAMAAAAPLVRDFADKMEELANVAPELSRSLAELTAATKTPRADGPKTPSATGSTGGDGARTPDFDRPSDTLDEVQNLIKVVCPALARLLSFEHLRASEPMGRELIQALVNLYEGMAPGTSPTLSQATASGSSTSVRSASAPSTADLPYKTPGPTPGSSGGVRTPSSAGSRTSMDSGRATMSAGSNPALSDASRVSSMNTSQVQQQELFKQREKLGKKATSWVAGIIKQMLTPKVYGGKLVRSKGLDELLGRRGVTAAHHDRAVQVELLRNIKVLQSLTVEQEGFDLKRQSTTMQSSSGQPKRDADRAVPSADTSSSSGRSNISSSNFGPQQHQKLHQPSGRKRPRPSVPASAASASSLGTLRGDSVGGGSAFGVEGPGGARLHDRPLNNPTFPTEGGQEGHAWAGSSRRNGGSSSSSSTKSGVDTGCSHILRLHDHYHDRGLRGEASGVVNLGGEACSEERRQGGWGAWPAAAGRTATTTTEESAAAALLENTIRSSRCMLETRGGHSGLPVQLLRACLRQDAYFLFPPRSRDSMDTLSSRAQAPAFQQLVPSNIEAASQATRDGRTTTRPPPTPPQPSHSGAHGSRKPSTATRPPLTVHGAASPPAMHSRGGPLPPPAVPLPTASLVLSKNRVSVPTAWEERVRGCLSALERRPLLCPDALLRGTGAVPPLPSQACVRGAMAVHGRYVDMNGSGDRNTHDGASTTSKVTSNGGSISSLKTEEFQLSEACLRVGLNLVENAVLQPWEGGGEAAAGLLRAFRTVRNSGGGGVGVTGGGGVSRDDRALAGGCRARVKGEALFEFVATLDQTPSGCVETSLDVLVFALDELGKKHCRREAEGHKEHGALFGSATTPAASSAPSPVERPFEEELWLLVLGYRHWIMLAMVHLLSTDACGSCDTHQDQRQAPAVQLLAWYACGGCAFTGPPQPELADAKEGVLEMATCLSDCANPGDAAAESRTREAKSCTAAEAHPIGAQASTSPAASAGAQIATALEAAREAGQGSMGAIFSPCLALAWLLTSRIALRNCETLLACGVLREEDLDGAFRGDEEIVGDSHEMALAFVEASTHRPSPPTSTRCCIEAILQGLAALEDLVWLCGLRPPLAHVHRGRDLKTMLKRIKTWLSGLGRHPTGGARGLAPRGDDALRDGRGHQTLADFSQRRDAISQSLSRLLSNL